MNVTDRIVQSSGYSAVSLNPTELALYQHAGYRLAHFEDGALVEFFDPMDFEDPVHALTGALQWMRRHDGSPGAGEGTGENWFVLCSGFSLCEPERLRVDDPASLKHLSEVIHQAFIDCRH